MSTDLDDRPVEAPVAHRISLALLASFLGLGLVTVALVGLLRERMVLNWAEGHRDAREIVAMTLPHRCPGEIVTLGWAFFALRQ